MIGTAVLKPFLSSGGAASGINRIGEGVIRGIPQAQINGLRGERDHLEDEELDAQTIQEDYARVGINISMKEAREIEEALTMYSQSWNRDIRDAFANAHQHGEAALSEKQREWLQKGRLIEEYTRVAPSIPRNSYSEVYRGERLRVDSAECKKKLALKPGDTLDLDNKPTSFSTDMDLAKNNFGFPGNNFGFPGTDASRQSVLIHMPTKNLQHGVSIRGASIFSYEDEVLVSDYHHKVKKIKDTRETSRNGDSYKIRHIYLE